MLYSTKPVLFRQLELSLAARGITRQGSQVVLVACSGGADSVALCHVASKLLGPSRVVLGHVDHGVRTDSSLDAEQVAALAKELGCSVQIHRLGSGPDDEARLRAARYQGLEALRAAAGAEYVLVAHTADDQAETVMLGLLRGTHVEALSGMPAVRGAVLRPWLAVPRSVVHQHVARHRLGIRPDPSNLEPRYLRNRIRKELLPLIEARYRSGFSKRLAALALELARPEIVGNSAALTDPEPSEASCRSENVPPRQPSVWFRKIDWVAPASIPHGHAHVFFDAAEVEMLRIRQIEAGDRIQGFGHRSPRKVRDVLREAGIAEDWRWLGQVVTDQDDRVLWVPGLLRAHHAQIGETTVSAWECGVDRKDELPGGSSRVTLDGAATGVYASNREKNE